MEETIANGITDPFGRNIDYVRLAVTDRCNLRCFYCMPAEGIDYVTKSQLLTYEEMLRLMKILSGQGVKKVRITGGEPFIRKDLIQFLDKLHDNDGIDKISITTNGILTKSYLPQLKDLGIMDINLSLDTIDANTFKKITRRDDFESVMDTFYQMLGDGFNLKINTVVMDGINDGEILSMSALTRDLPISVRFIEEMPFNGSNNGSTPLKWDHKAIFKTIEEKYPDIATLQSPSTSTSLNFQIPGHKGTIGIIAAYSRTFCGTCNRIRVTPTGQMRTCLYGKNVLDLRSLLRKNSSDKEIVNALHDVIGMRTKDGFEAEKMRNNQPISESMSTIGG